MRTKFLSEHLGADGKMLEWMLGKWDGKMLTVCMWLRMGTSGGLLWTR